jgi:CRISPR-associated endonuclease/helicase Cas3
MLSAPWGKFDNEAGTRHHLAHHCADVAACFLRIVRSPAIANRLDRAAGQPLSQTDLARLAVIVFLHDSGKLHPGFQSKGWPAGIWTKAPFGHVQEGIEIFMVGHSDRVRPAAASLYIDALNEWKVQPSLLRAVISHHGRPAPMQLNPIEHIEHYWRAVRDYDPDLAAAEIGRCLPGWFPDAFVAGGATLPDKAAFDHLMCGLTTLADWVGSDVTWFPHIGDLDQGYMAHAMKAAETACRAVGLDTVQQRAARTSPVTFKDVSCFAIPRPPQALVGASDLEAQVLILEAETGSGKTEAALWRYALLFEAGRVDGLYFAVPTRAAAIQLHKRVVEATKRLFGEASPEPILAVPGYMRAGEVEGRPLPHWRVLWDDAATADRSALEARWAAEHSKRYLAAPIAVGTVDQAMLAALKVKHAHLRAGSLSRSLLVIDEVHASDRYMNLIQKRLLDSHTAVGGYALLMSATLGSEARSKWLGHELPAFVDACKVPYPAVWTSLAVEPGKPKQDRDTPQKSVRMELLATMAPEVAAGRALRAAHDGARVLIIRNTVTRAVETLAALEALIAPEDDPLRFNVNGIATLHHSRFAPSDRKLLDAAVEATLKPDKNRAQSGCVVVGTQTLEQSLDIDADLLLTDLCPVDVLLQRIGRLHRHKLPRPVGFEEPRCLVMVPENGLESLLAPKFDNGLGAWRDSGGVLQGVYRDLSILELTRRLLCDNDVWTIPDMNRFLVESAVHSERIEALHDELSTDWKRYNADIIGRELGDALAASGALIDRRKPFEALQFPKDGEERIRTRLGAEGVRVHFAEPHPTGPFGEIVSEVVLPAHWSRGLVVDDAPIAHASAAGAILFSVGGTNFRYDRMGVAKARGHADEPADGSTHSDRNA